MVGMRSTLLILPLSPSHLLLSIVLEIGFWEIEREKIRETYLEEDMWILSEGGQRETSLSEDIKLWMLKTLSLPWLPGSISGSQRIA